MLTLCYAFWRARFDHVIDSASVSRLIIFAIEGGLKIFCVKPRGASEHAGMYTCADSPRGYVCVTEAPQWMIKQKNVSVQSR